MNERLKSIAKWNQERAEREAAFGFPSQETSDIRFMLSYMVKLETSLEKCIETKDPNMVVSKQPREVELRVGVGKQYTDQKCRIFTITKQVLDLFLAHHDFSEGKDKYYLDDVADEVHTLSLILEKEEEE